MTTLSYQPHAPRPFPSGHPARSRRFFKRPSQGMLPMSRQIWKSTVCATLDDGVEVGGRHVIEVTRMNGDVVTVNSDRILFVEASPDTILTLSNGEKIKIQEDISLLRDRVLAFKQLVFSGGVHQVQHEESKL